MAEGGRFDSKNESRFFVQTCQGLAEGGRFELPLQITPD